MSGCTFYKNPQVSFKSSYKFIKKVTSIIVSLILSNHIIQDCIFENCLLFDDLTSPILRFSIIYTNIGATIYKGLEDIKFQKLDQMLVVIKNKKTLETIRVFTLNITYKNVEDNDGGNEDVSRITKFWHCSGLPQHIKNQVKCLLLTIPQVLSVLPSVPHDHLNVELLLLDRDSEQPAFNFPTKPLKMQLGTVDTLYHNFNLELACLDVNSNFKIIEAQQNWRQRFELIDFRNKTNSGISCTSSDFTYSDMKELEQHIVSSSTDKTCKCNVCSYTCTDPCKVKRHRCVKSGENPRKKYSRIKKHITVKKYNCNVCNYKSTVSWHIKRHMNIHMGIKPFKCGQCNYSSMDSWHINRHMQYRHKRVMSSPPKQSAVSL